MTYKSDWLFAFHFRWKRIWKITVFHLNPDRFINVSAGQLASHLMFSFLLFFKRDDKFNKQYSASKRDDETITMVCLNLTLSFIRVFMFLSLLIYWWFDCLSKTAIKSCRSYLRTGSGANTKTVLIRNKKRTIKVEWFFVRNFSNNFLFDCVSSGKMQSLLSVLINYSKHNSIIRVLLPVFILTKHKIFHPITQFPN